MMKNARASRGREHGLGLKMWLCLSLAVSSGCSTAATVPADSPDEAYIRDLLFSNNRTGRTYFASYFLPYVRIEDECLDLNGLDEPRTVELLAKHQVTAANADLDRPYIAGTEMRRIITGITIDVPRYSRLFNMPKSRRKSGGGNIICGTGNPQFAHLRRPLTFRLTRDATRFAALWRSPAPKIGFVSPSRKSTPNCYVSVTAAPNNEVMSTDVHVLMPAFGIEDFRSHAFVSCLIRGSLAALGLPGVLNKADAALLRPNADWELTTGRDKIGYWDPRPLSAAQLYDRPGASWPEVRAEWRRMQPTAASATRLPIPAR